MSESNPSLPLVWSAFTGYQHTASVRAAVELDVFTAIGEGATTLDRLAKRCGAAERGLRALCNHLVMDGFLARNGDAFSLTPTSEAFLDRRSSGYVGSAVLFISEPTIVEGFTRLTEAVRRGGTAIPQSGTLAPEHPIWVEFARSMAPLASLTGVLLANVLDASKAGACKVLDIAAGHGMFGISIASENPKAQVVGLDWKNVLEVARANAAAVGLGERYRTIAGSAFEVDWGQGYDLVLLPNFLHHFDAKGCVAILEKAARALAPGGRVAIVEFVPDDDRSGPPDAVRFALVMLASTPAGDAYTFAEYRDMLRRAGFLDPSVHDLLPSPSRVILARRA